jgi:hypothetical protein
MNVSCVETSHWQDFPDFEKMRADGVTGNKATEGTS